MTTRVQIRSPHGNHLAVLVQQFAPNGVSVDPTTAALLDHGRRFEGYVHSSCAYQITEVARPDGGAPTYELSRGEKLAGVSFNPSGDPRVSEAKDGYADRMNEVMALQHGVTDPDQRKMLEDAQSHLMAAQMLVVKAITWRG